MRNVISHLKKYIIKKKEKKYFDKIRKINNNINPTIICNNCMGGVIYHNLGLQFLSPTINLFIKGNDYLNFCRNLKYYSNCELIQIEDNTNNYPVGCLIPHDNEHQKIMIYFQHYKSFEEAKYKWMERFKRVNWDNMYFIWEFYDTLYDTRYIYEFDKTDLKGKKMLLLHREFPNIKHAFVLSCYKDDLPMAKAFEYKGISGKRYLDEFDYVKFLNK